MKTSLNWLKNYVTTNWDAEELAEKLTLAGLEVEGIQKSGDVPAGVVIAEIKERRKHPNADKLSLCEVDNGSGELVQVVCGAPNCDAGKKVPMATVGTELGEGFKIKKAKLRGEVSYGMLCSAAELGISDDQEGLMELSEDAVPGKPLSDYLEQDTVIDWEITPNRPDWLSHIGIAREAAAVSGRTETFKRPDATLPHATAPTVEELVTVNVQDPDLCPRYTARIIRNVKIAPSPDWLKQALTAVGIRPINNVVDITNFVLLECGQPLHAFDYELLGGQHIIVRRAADGEKMTTLDGTEHTLSADNLLIADSKCGVALAGIMGGGNSEISQDTTTVLLESAAFNPSNTRATAKKLGLATESSHRFERGIDIEMVEFASRRAASLICELAGGELAEGVIDAYPEPYTPHQVTCRISRCNQLIGINLEAETIADLFMRLGLHVDYAEDDHVTVSIPPFRLDLEREADLIEEVARLYGLDKIPNVPLVAQAGGTLENDAYAPLQQVREDLLAFGLTEAMTYSLLGTESATLGSSLKEDNLVKLANPISAEGACMRPSLLPGMLAVVEHNLAHDCPDLAMFEIGRVIANQPGQPEERQQAAIVLTGRAHPERYGSEREMAYDFFDLKGLLEGWFEGRRLLNLTCDPVSHPAFKEGHAAEFRVDGKPVAVLGEVKNNLSRRMRLNHPLFMALVELDILNHAVSAPRVFRSLPQFPATARDISLVAPEAVTNREIIDTIYGLQNPWLAGVELFDLYEDEKQLGKGKRSLAYSLTYRDCTRTLKDEEVNQAHEKVRKKLAEKLPVELR
ncbi:MAG: phenylalanine--tRNA ligase subunit beta [Lentisphaeria bacterium]